MPNEKGRRRRFGSVRQLRSGRYQARYQGPDGLPRTAPKTFDTEADALRWLTVTEAEVIRGDWFDWTAGEVPLREYAGKWIVERAGLAPRTVELYQSLLRLHIAPKLGNLDLIYLHANRGASKAIAAGIDRQLAEAAQQQDANGADDDDPSGT
jgi:hypothetical protein